MLGFHSASQLLPQIEPAVNAQFSPAKTSKGGIYSRHVFVEGFDSNLWLSHVKGLLPVDPTGTCTDPKCTNRFTGLCWLFFSNTSAHNVDSFKDIQLVHDWETALMEETFTWDESSPFSSDSSSTLRSISEELILKSLFCFNISFRRVLNLKQKGFIL